MTAQYRTASANENGSDNTLTLTIPAGAQTGELALAHVSYFVNAPATISADPAGWSTLGSWADGDTGVRVYSRVLQAGDAGSTVIIGFSAVNKAAGSIVTCTGSLDTYGWVPLATSTTVMSTSSLTAATDNSLIVDFLANKQGLHTPASAPAGRTMRAQAQNDSGGVNLSAVGTGTQSSAGSVASVNYTVPESMHGGAVTIVVEPSDHATFDLTAHYATDTGTPITEWVLDATGSTGATALTQMTGTTAAVNESPTGIFTITNPSGSDDLGFDLDAGADTLSVTITRGIGRPAFWVKSSAGWK